MQHSSAIIKFRFLYLKTEISKALLTEETIAKGEGLMEQLNLFTTEETNSISHVLVELIILYNYCMDSFFTGKVLSVSHVYSSTSSLHSTSYRSNQSIMSL